MITFLVTTVILLLLSSGFTSMTEAALFSVPIARVHLALSRNRPGSRRLARIKENLHRPVAALVILNNAINIGGSIFVGFIAREAFGSSRIAIFSAVLTFLFIVFAEIIPKTIGERFNEGISLATAPAILVLTQVLFPLIWLIEKISAPFSTRQRRRVASEEEIRVLAHLGSQRGEISGQERELIRRAFRLNDVTARDIMTHRLKLASLPAEKELREIRPRDLDLSHSRILVTENGDLDKVNGVVYLRDLLLALARGETEGTVGALKKPTTFVFESSPAHRLLVQFQKTRQHLFVVVDEYGGTSGVVCLEDVLEELVGEINDETDPLPESSVAGARTAGELPPSPGSDTGDRGLRPTSLAGGNG